MLKRHLKKIPSLHAFKRPVTFKSQRVGTFRPPPFIAFSVHKDDTQIKNDQIFTKAYLLSMGF